MSKKPYLLYSLTAVAGLLFTSIVLDINKEEVKTSSVQSTESTSLAKNSSENQNKEAKEAREAKASDSDSIDSKDSKVSQGLEVTSDSKESKELKELKELKEHQEHQELKETEDSSNNQELKDSKALNNSKDTDVKAKEESKEELQDSSKEKAFPASTKMNQEDKAEHSKDVDHGKDVDHDKEVQEKKESADKDKYSELSSEDLTSVSSNSSNPSASSATLSNHSLQESYLSSPLELNSPTYKDLGQLCVYASLMKLSVADHLVPEAKSGDAEVSPSATSKQEASKDKAELLSLQQAFKSLHWFSDELATRMAILYSDPKEETELGLEVNSRVQLFLFNGLYNGADLSKEYKVKASLTLESKTLDINYSPLTRVLPLLDSGYQGNLPSHLSLYFKSYAELSDKVINHGKTIDFKGKVAYIDFVSRAPLTREEGRLANSYSCIFYFHPDKDLLIK